MRSSMRMVLRSLLSVALLLCSTTSAAVASTGSTVTLNDVAYFLPPKVVATVSVGNIWRLFDDVTFLPFTVVKGIDYTVAELTRAIAKYLEEDDVFQEGFLEGV